VKSNFCIYLNGPGGCGKDTISDILNKNLWAVNTFPATHTFMVNQRKFIFPCKQATHAAYGMMNKPIESYSECKDEPHPDFYDVTPRNAYIDMGEHMRDTYGQDFWGKVEARNLSKHIKSTGNMYDLPILVVYSDLGKDEDKVHIEKMMDNQLLIRITREGCTYEGDCRYYVEDLQSPHTTIDFLNDGNDLLELETRIMETVNAWIRSVQ